MKRNNLSFSVELCCFPVRCLSSGGFDALSCLQQVLFEGPELFCKRGFFWGQCLSVLPYIGGMTAAIVVVALAVVAAAVMTIVGMHLAFVTHNRPTC